jgi:hypothetical protein
MNKIDHAKFGEYAREAGVTAVRIAFVMFVCAMAFALWRLGDVFGQPNEYKFLVALGCSVGVFGHGVAITRSAGNTNTGRMLHGVALATWLLISVFLSALYALTSSARLAAYVPDTMPEIGAIVYALVFALGLFTSTLALVIPAVAQRPIADHENPTLGSSVARFGEPLFLVLCIGASTLHLFEFGMSVAKVGMFATVAACAIADLAFIVSEKRVLHELKERNATGRHDRFDLVLWGVFGLMVLAYLVLVNLYAVRYTAGTLNPDDPMLKMTIDFYGISPTALIFSMAALALITAMIDNKAGADTVTIRRPAPLGSRIASQIKQARAGVGEIAGALRSDPQPAQISPPAQREVSQMAAGDRDRVTVQTVTKEVRPAKDRSEKARRCKWCKTPFTATDGRAQYCSPKCRKAASRAVDSSHSHDEE